MLSKTVTKRTSSLLLGAIIGAASFGAVAAQSGLDKLVQKTHKAPFACDQIVQKQGYAACYNYGLKATLWTAHSLKASDLKAEGYSRKGIKFYEETALPKRYRATLATYRGSGFDRSHLVPNDDQNHNRKLQKETFSLVCQSPHYPNVNRRSLLAVEKLIRRLARSNGEARVFSGNVFNRIVNKRIGAERVAVPEATYKVLQLPEKTFAFLIPNVKEKQSKRPKDFLVELSVIEKKTGFRFNRGKK